MVLLELAEMGRLVRVMVLGRPSAGEQDRFSTTDGPMDEIALSGLSVKETFSYLVYVDPGTAQNLLAVSTAFAAE